MAAVHAFLMMAFGLSMGPQITAFFTDFILMDESKLSMAVAMTGFIVLPLAALLFKIALLGIGMLIKNIHQLGYSY